MKRTIETHRMDWNGHLLEIIYETDWFPSPGLDLAHLQVRSIYPINAPLPIAPDGLYAHALPASIITAAGGPVNYIDVMLAEKAQSAVCSFDFAVDNPDDLDVDTQLNICHHINNL